MKIKPKTHIVLADSEKFLILQNHGHAALPDLRVVDSAVRNNPPSHKQGTGKPGRFPDPKSQYSAVAETDWHRLEKENAAKDLAARLNTLAKDKQVQDIIIIADAKTLGLVRPKLKKMTVDKIRAQISKDLTHHTVPEIEKILLAAEPG